MAPKLSVCVVTECLERINLFLSVHRRSFSHPDIELLIFCTDEIAVAIRAQLSDLPRCEIVSDNCQSGPNRKRNVLLERAAGRFVVFLDDDSFFVEPERTISSLLARMDATADWLLWTVRYRYTNDRSEHAPPRSIGPTGPGSGIEWNQAFRRNMLLSLGGWHPDFCTGEKWRSGGALKLMIHLASLGHKQQLVPEVMIEHPAQLDENDSRCVDKMLRYRYAIGAVIASEAQHIGWLGLLAWTVRLMVVAPLRGAIDFALGRSTSSLVRLRTPALVVRGAVDWSLQQRVALHTGA